MQKRRVRPYSHDKLSRRAQLRADNINDYLRHVSTWERDDPTHVSPITAIATAQHSYDKEKALRRVVFDSKLDPQNCRLQSTLCTTIPWASLMSCRYEFHLQKESSKRGRARERCGKRKC